MRGKTSIEERQKRKNSSFYILLTEVVWPRGLAKEFFMSKISLRKYEKIYDGQLNWSYLYETKLTNDHLSWGKLKVRLLK